MKTLLVITQKVDINDDLLGSFVGWLKEFSQRFDRVEVIALSKGEYDLPSNVTVHSLGKDTGNSRFVRLLKFYKLLFRLVPRSVGIFAHMSPIFAVTSWPLAFLFRKKIILWYLHRSVTGRLKLAEKMVTKIVTSSRDSLKFKSEKILELGHGIDLDYFNSSTLREFSNPLHILSVGRISKIKGYETLLGAAKILKERGVNFVLKIVGQPIMPSDFSYFEELKALRIKWDLEREVEFVGFVPYSKILPYYHEAQILINPLPSGGLDRTVLEGMAMKVIPLTSNDIFARYFGDYAKELVFEYQKAENLANKIVAIQNWPIEKKNEAVAFLRGAVAQFHDKKELIKNIAQLYSD
ncbi:MAG: glycosyltransferase family 4 protein [bacterium]|nr:glycosyltransferase family 4 protein [bacterium]